MVEGIKTYFGCFRMDESSGTNGRSLMLQSDGCRLLLNSKKKKNENIQINSQVNQDQ